MTNLSRPGIIDARARYRAAARRLRNNGLVGTELFHEDGHTYMAKLTVAFRNFANAPKNAWNLFPLPPYTSMPWCTGGNFTATILVSLLYYAVISQSTAQ